MVLFAASSLLPCLASHIFPLFSYWFKMLNPCFVTSYNICKIPLFKCWKQFQQLLKNALYQNQSFVLLSVAICVIHIAEIFLTFEIRFKMKCHQLWLYHKSCISHHFQIFPRLLRHLPYLLQSQVGQSFSSLNSVNMYIYFLPKDRTFIFLQYSQPVYQPFLQQQSTTDSFEITISFKLCRHEDSCLYF